MKKIFNLFILAFSLVVIGISLSETVSANESIVNPPPTPTLTTTVTNTLTGEVTYIDEEAAGVTQSVLGNEASAEFNVEVPISGPELESGDQMSTFDIEESIIESGGVTARLTVDYDIGRSGNDYTIRVNRVYGGWTPASNLYVLSNRSHGAHGGINSPTNVLSYETTTNFNNFNRTTNWGYGVLMYAEAAPRAWSEVLVTIPGMGGQNRINLEITLSN